jgi:hypothetical protein
MVSRAARLALCLTLPFSAGATHALAQSPTPRIVSAANAFLATLSQAQKDSVVFPFDDQGQRKRWSNLPEPMVQRGGLSMGSLSAAQRSSAMALLASVLSKRGYEKIQQIVEADEVLKTSSGGGGANARRPLFGKDFYFISLLGRPSETQPWMLQFGGHHLALNVTIAGAQGVLTPSLTGAQPGLYTVNGKTIRPLGQESDKALALLNSLDSTQRHKAVLSFTMADLVLGPGQDDKQIQPEGLKASEMTPAQRTALLGLIAEWSGIVHESAAQSRMAELTQDINETWFAWSGPVTAEAGHNITAYYRIQGPHLVIEYAPQNLGGDPSMHIHSMYRDPTNDYGRKLTAK